tara:strand:- start:3667 stop:4680 length:1014 start_codon:yes stop_codon:yes gene_type:complete
MSDAFQESWDIVKDFYLDPPSLADVYQMRGPMGHFVPPDINSDDKITDLKTRWQYDKDGNPEKITEKVEPYLPRGYKPGFAGVNLGSHMWDMLYGIYRQPLRHSPRLEQGITDTLTHESTHKAMDSIIREILQEEYMNKVKSGELSTKEAQALANKDYGQFHEYGAYASEFGTPAYISREERDPVKRMKIYSQHPATRSTPKQAFDSAELLDVARTLMPKLPNYGLSTRKDRNDNYEVIQDESANERADELYEQVTDDSMFYDLGQFRNLASEPDDNDLIDTMMTRKPYEHYSDIDFDFPQDSSERDLIRRFNRQKSFKQAMGLRARENAKKRQQNE